MQIIFRSCSQYFDSENAGTAHVILDLISIKITTWALKILTIVYLQHSVSMEEFKWTYLKCTVDAQIM